MELEVFVPVSAEALRQTLRDPARVARCVPGLQQDARDGEAAPESSVGALAGRMKVRIGGHTITYRGALTLTERDGAFDVAGEGVAVRGTGSAKFTLAIRVTDAPQDDDGASGATVVLTGSTRAEGRLAELPAETVTAAASRLLDRVVTRLAEEAAALAAEDPDGADGAEDPGGADPVDPADGLGELADLADLEGLERLERLEGLEGLEQLGGFDGPQGETVYSTGDFHLPGGPGTPGASSDEPPAEAAHARRTMIGRSAEEVDHAPPRGRYAPVPAPDTVGGGGTMRWIAPAAALALASAVVVGRALRRRR
ncbi:SRPBCC domain-containing protein [Streptomyces paludis]|uniref:Carbon monoxide dehydrogenase n=1 Tax=Streptomyces paludis TaxID=2282738 RepID=A0A345HRF5_9ACTN|nr:SRPBCC domain-containing protein [Streptomyces paludis]AXG79279.1 carbon monoxide dehydrogenase [Streptomyces paludis]